MKFMMMVIGNEENWRDVTPEQRAEIYETMDVFNQEMRDAGILVSAAGLQPQSTARTVRFGGGDPLATDGPFAEMKEAFAGYWIVEVASSDDAVSWAKRAPMGDGAAIEIRPLEPEP